MFPEYTYAQSMVTGALFQNMDESACDPELLGTLKRLLLSSNSNDLEYRTLDRYLVAFFLSCTNGEILQTVPWQHFVLVDEHVFSPDCLVDIGRNIRQIILGDLETETLTRLVFFSLPYLKHNRLNLPPLHDTKFHELQACMRIVYASCLGMLQRNSKKPPWSMRVQLHVFTHQLLVNGTHQDLHVFFKHHLAILRISLIEYIIFFILQNMHMEKRAFEKIFGGEHANALQFNEILCLINNFRIQAYDEACLDTVRLNEKALLALERCNRMCTCKMNSTTMLKKADVMQEGRHADRLAENFKFAFSTPRVDSLLLLHVLHTDKSFQDVQCIAAIQRSVAVYQLPSPLYNKQIAALQAIYKTNSLRAIYTTRCSVCLLCGLNHERLDDKMRIHDNDSIFCSGCNSSTYVITINTLGVLLNIRGLVLFWCPCCGIVHKWLGTGFDCTSCTYTRKSVAPHVKECLMCKKRNSIQDVEVLNADLGFMSTLTLCYKHRPWDYQLKWVSDLDSLKQALHTKMTAKPLY
jgi:hypothetical protein